ncbi:hypothetical protein [Oceanobacillus locisalsi]|uniref:Uncharacterized protein n=1 Tax=Oceanobacillus locisalsi TaxID=546107 RepID=A0ABW3NMW4_9BACI
MKKKETSAFYSLYGTIIGSIVIALIVFGINAGFTTLFCFVLLPILIVYLSFKFLPQLWAFIILSSMIIFGVHSFIGMWRFTITCTVFFALIIMVDYIIKNKKIVGKVNMAIMILFYITILILINLDSIDRWLNTPELTEGNMQEAAEIIEGRDDVLSASTGIDEDHFDEEAYIYIVLDVADKLTRDQKITAGEDSAEILDMVMHEENDMDPGDLYHYYDVEIRIGMSDVLIGRKEIDSEEIKWQPPLE